MLRLAVLAVFCCLLPGCASKFVQATLENRSGEPLTLVQVEYPTASFGTQSLLAGTTFHYRFKLIGSGPVKLTWEDASRKDHSLVGPKLDEGQQGQLSIVFTARDKAEFSTSVRP